MANFVLVHGAWCCSLCWRATAQALRRAGHEVYAPTLTGLGARKHLLSRQVTLGTHIQDVLGVLDEEDLADIVLVGHSYAGMVVTGVADTVPEKIASLVYLDAFVPEHGQALIDIVPNRPEAVQAPLPIPGAEWLLPPPPPEAFGEPSDAVRDFTARKMSPHPLACFTQPLALKGGVERIRRKTYIYCNDPHPTTLTPTYERLRVRPDWTVQTLPCTHNAQLDMPEELAALLLQAASPA